MQEIIACPLEFDLPGMERKGNVHYIAPCISEHAAKTEKFCWPVIEKDKKLIYICLGSRVLSFLEKAREYYRLFFEVLRHATDRNWYFIFSFSPDIDIKEFKPIPENVSVYSWAPQCEILEKASLCINHGGLGSIKECIFWGVPMLIFPFVADQFKNSERVKMRKLGDIGIPDASVRDRERR